MRRPLIMLAVLASFALGACSSTITPDRYAFWRDDTKAAPKTNLGDVPAAPDTAAAKAEMEAIRKRLETDRMNALRAAQGLPPIEQPAVTSSDTSLNNATPPTSHQGLDVMELAPPQPSQGSYQAGNVMINYDPAPNTYVYSNSPVQVDRSLYQEQAAQLMAANSSVSIDFSALGGDGTAAASALPVTGLTGQPIVFFHHGSARLGTIDRMNLRELAQKLKQEPSSVVIVGHASKRTGLQDAVAAKEVNLKMASKRAAVVMRELARQGVPAAKLNVTAAGDTQPNRVTTGKPQEQADRRVELLFD